MELPSVISGLKIRTIDDDEIPLWELLDETCKEEPIQVTYTVTQEDDSPYLQKFSLWTENYIVTLIHTGHGSYLLKHDRNAP